MQWRTISLVVVLSVAAQLAILFLQLNSGIPKHHDADPEPVSCKLESYDTAVHRFAQLIRFPSLSNAETPLHIKAGSERVFDEMLTFLEKSFPLVWEQMVVEKVGAGGYSRLFKWDGTDSDKEGVLPVMFVSHYDVVPVTEGTESDWTHAPFSGDVADGFLWGRGTLDVKFSVAALLEAATLMLEAGVQPKRTVYFFFGHDEEVGGMEGARRGAELLASRNIELSIIIDEGGTIFQDGVRPFVTDHPVALVGTAEKVYTSIEVRFSSSGGHSSMPPTDGSDIASQMARFISHINLHPLPADLRTPTTDFLRALVPYTSSWLLRPLMWHCQAWPLRQLVSSVFVAASKETAALVRTTVAVTRISAGVADNVLPQQGSLILNMRSHPNTLRSDLLAFAESALHKTGALPGASAVLTNASHTGPVADVASVDSPYFKAVKQALQEFWQYNGKAIGVVPFLMTGGTDSKHFADLSRAGVLRILPYAINKTAGDLGRVHGTNERVSVDDFKRAICTYRRMIELLAV